MANIIDTNEYTRTSGHVPPAAFLRGFYFFDEQFALAGDERSDGAGTSKVANFTAIFQRDHQPERFRPLCRSQDSSRRFHPGQQDPSLSLKKLHLEVVSRLEPTLAQGDNRIKKLVHGASLCAR
jgi:hypothetical protein